MNGIYHAKIVPPRLQGVIPRERLFKVLDELAVHPVTWISSPAGSGKTTLVTSYLKARGIPVLWYRVDEADADPATFFYCMAEAVKTHKKGKKKQLPLFTPEYRNSLGTFTRNYFDSFFNTISSPCAVVFDNYQDVPETSEIHSVITNGLKMVSEGLRVFVMSRKVFPSPFVSLEVGGMLVSLAWDDIRFTVDEVQAMISQQSKAAISKTLAHRVHEETQGWAAAVVLMIGRKEAALTKIESVGYSSVLSYFAVEVFERLDADTQRLLLGTAFLPSISPESGYELAGVENSSRILADLNRNHCFVYLYGDEYQCHPLFREFLFSRIEQTFSKEEIYDARKRAGTFLLKSGQIEAGINLLSALSDWASVIPAILSIAPSLVSKGRDKTVKNMIDKIPEGICTQTPWLIYWLAVCIQHYDPSEGYALFARSFALFKEKNDMNGALYAWAGAVHSILFKGWDMKLYDEWIDWLDARMSKDHSFPSSEIEANVASGMLGALLARHPDRPDLWMWLGRAHTLSKPLSALAYMLMGDYQHWATATRELEKTTESSNVFFTLCWHYYKACLINETGISPEPALNIVREGLELSEKSGISHWVPLLLGEGFYAATRTDQLEVGLEFLHRLETILDGPPGINHARYHSAHAFYHILTGDVESAITEVEKGCKSAAETGFIPVEALLNTDAAFIFIEAERPLEAKKYIEACRALPISSSRIVTYNRLIAEAALLLYEGSSGVSDVLREAFSIGKREGYMAPYSWWQPALMARLCEVALKEQIEVEYARKLIKTYHLVPISGRLEDFSEWPWPCHIRTFGEIELTVNDARVFPQRQKKPIDLLNCLISLGGDEVRQETIEDELWPDAEGDMARISFKTNLSRLRKVVGEKTIEVKEGKVSLNPRYVWLDLWALESLADKVSKLFGERRRSTPVSELEKLANLAFAVYRGDFLASEDHSWLVATRKKLQTRFAKTLERLTSMMAEAGEQEKAGFFNEKAIEAGIPPDAIKGFSPSK